MRSGNSTAAGAAPGGSRSRLLALQSSPPARVDGPAPVLSREGLGCKPTPAFPNKLVKEAKNLECWTLLWVQTESPYGTAMLKPLAQYPSGCRPISTRYQVEESNTVWTRTQNPTSYAEGPQSLAPDPSHLSMWHEPTVKAGSPNRKKNGVYVNGVLSLAKENLTWLTLIGGKPRPYLTRKP
ncbi:Hypothetical predicted protein [Marmota monax]|uniref:Uncharacterized protein n=1 Tax=Marmota monax TaxID=9995 RepID=A0A5E4ALH3_MARMO|nr:Hypothetical predicted protein [Marmota monax]